MTLNDYDIYSVVKAGDLLEVAGNTLIHRAHDDAGARILFPKSLICVLSAQYAYRMRIPIVEIKFVIAFTNVDHLPPNTTLASMHGLIDVNLGVTTYIKKLDASDGERFKSDFQKYFKVINP